MARRESFICFLLGETIREREKEKEEERNKKNDRESVREKGGGCREERERATYTP